MARAERHRRRARGTPAVGTAPGRHLFTGVPQNHGIQDQTEGLELVLLAVPIELSELARLAVGEVSGEQLALPGWRAGCLPSRRHPSSMPMKETSWSGLAMRPYGAKDWPR